MGDALRRQDHQALTECKIFMFSIPPLMPFAFSPSQTMGQILNSGQDLIILVYRVDRYWSLGINARPPFLRIHVMDRHVNVN
jgi:hypothetical protein